MGIAFEGWGKGFLKHAFCPSSPRGYGETANALQQLLRRHGCRGVSGRYGLQIRAPEAADASGLATLFLASGLAVPATAIAARLAAMAHGPGAALIAEVWGPPSGIVTVHWYAGLLADQLAARMTLLLVAPEARRHGLGRVLVKAAARAARIAGCDRLECFAPGGETELRAFLLAAGFVQTGDQFVRPLRKKA